MGSSLSGTAVESDVYLALGLDQSGTRVPGTPQVLFLLASLLERTIQENEKQVTSSRWEAVSTILDGSRAPSISIRQYIERIFKYSKCSTSCFVVGYIYMERFLRRTDAHLSPLNVHRLLITSIMIAAKFLDDECYDNAYYARIGGTSTAEMNRMEMKLLFDLDFNLHVTAEVFRDYCLMLAKEADVHFQFNQPIRHIWYQRKPAKKR